MNAPPTTNLETAELETQLPLSENSPKIAELPVRRLKMSEVSHHQDNPRYHNRTQIELIADSIEEHGYAKGSMVVQQSTMTLVAGNGVYDALTLLEYEEADFVIMDMGDTEALKFLIRDNRLSELSRWDLPVLNADLAILKDEGVELEDVAFDLESMDGLESDYAKGQADNRVIEEDDPPEVEEGDPITQYGDLWHLGRHKVLNGDSTKTEDVERVMGGEKAVMVIADPPYGMRLDADFSVMKARTDFASAIGVKTGKAHDPVIGDGQDFDASPIINQFGADIEQFWFGADYYSATIGNTEHAGSWLVWDKRVEENMDRMFGSSFELIFSKVRHKRDILRHKSSGMFGSIAGSRIHPTQKPVVLLADIIERYAEAVCIIYDPFLGSGTTLIAANQLDRICYGIEISPQYVDVIVKRYINHVGSSESVFVERDGKQMSWEQCNSTRLQKPIKVA